MMAGERGGGGGGGGERWTDFVSRRTGCPVHVDFSLFFFSFFFFLVTCVH